MGRKVSTLPGSLVPPLNSIYSFTSNIFMTSLAGEKAASDRSSYPPTLAATWGPLDTWGPAEATRALGARRAKALSQNQVEASSPAEAKSQALALPLALAGSPPPAKIPRANTRGTQPQPGPWLLAGPSLGLCLLISPMPLHLSHPAPGDLPAHLSASPLHYVSASLPISSPSSVAWSPSLFPTCPSLSVP